MAEAAPSSLASADCSEAQLQQQSTTPSWPRWPSPTAKATALSRHINRHQPSIGHCPSLTASRAGDEGSGLNSLWASPDVCTMYTHTWYKIQNTEYRSTHSTSNRPPVPDTCARPRPRRPRPGSVVASASLIWHPMLACLVERSLVPSHSTPSANCQLPTDETGQKPSPTRATASRCRTTATIMFQTGTCRSSSVRHKPSLVSLDGWHCCAVALPARLTLCRDAQRAPCLKLQIQPRRPTSDAVTQPQWHNRTGASAWPRALGRTRYRILAAQRRPREIPMPSPVPQQDIAPAADASARPEHHGAVGRKNIGCEA